MTEVFDWKGLTHSPITILSHLIKPGPWVSGSTYRSTELKAKAGLSSQHINIKFIYLDETNLLTQCHQAQNSDLVESDRGYINYLFGGCKTVYDTQMEFPSDCIPWATCYHNMEAQ